MRLDQLTSPIIQNAISLEAAKVGSATIRTGWALLQQTLETYLPDAPRWRVKLPKLTSPELFTPTDADIQAVIDALSDRFSEAARFAALTGLRREEICGLRWSAIDFDRNVLYVRRVIVKDKNGKWLDVERTKSRTSKRVVDLLPVAVELLKALPKNGDSVFNIASPEAFTAAMERARSKVGLPKFRLHDTRRFNATVNAELGLPTVYTQDQLGHSTAQQTLHYQGIRDTARASYITLKDQKLNGIRKKLPKKQRYGEKN